MATFIISISRSATDSAFVEDLPDRCCNHNRVQGVAVKVERTLWRTGSGGGFSRMAHAGNDDQKTCLGDF